MTFLLVGAVLLGGLRDPRLAAAGGIATAFFLWRERPALGAVRGWLAWLLWGALAAAAGGSWAAAPVLARWAAATGFLALASAWPREERAAWLRAVVGLGVVAGAAALWTGWRGHYRETMTGLLPPYYNYSAFVLSAAAAAAGAWLLHPDRPKGGWRVAAAVAAGLSVGVIVLARSRGAALGLAFAAAVWCGRRWGRKAVVALAAAGVVSACAVSGLPALRAYAVKTDRLRGEARPRLWRAAVAAATDAPWLGAGPGRFAAAYRRHQVPTPNAAARYGLSTDFAHSEPLQAAVETGWVGFALWLGAFCAGLLALRGRSDEEPAREAAAAAAAAMAAQLAVDNMLQLPGLAFLFFSAVAVAGRRAPSGAPWPRWGAAALGLICATAWIPGSWAAGRPDRCARLFPEDAAAVEDLAYREAAAGRLDAADALWARAESLAPFDAIYPWRRAEIAAARGLWSVAEADAGRAEALEPGFARARLLRADALVRLGRKADAAAETGEIRRLLASPPPGAAENGYERTVAGFDAADRAALSRVEAASRGR